jgi:hypothetical protein
MPSVVTVRELARTFENEIGAAGGVAKRRWVCNLSDDTLTAGGPPSASAILEAVNGGPFSGQWGAYHPVHSLLRMRKLIINERFEDDPYKIEVVVEYGLVTSQELLTPVDRAAVWSFESQPGEIPALAYYDANASFPPDKPLTNSAFDFFPGLTTEESMVRIRVQQNFATYPNLWLAAQNHLNNAEFLGCGIDTVKVAAVEATYTTEEWNNTLVSYYASTASLLYRQSSHNLLIPDVGFNFIDGGQKRRGMVFDFQNAEWVPSPNPIALNGSGMQNLLGVPAILTRRVNPRANFTTLFGSPP